MKIGIILGINFIKEKFQAQKINIIIKYIGYLHQLSYKYMQQKQIKNQAHKTKNKISKIYHYFYQINLTNYNQYYKIAQDRNNKHGYYSQHPNAMNANSNKNISINFREEDK